MSAVAAEPTRAPAELDRVFERVGQDAAVLSAIEIGLGSFLHSLRVPFRGHFLSLNETFWLTRALRRESALGTSRARLVPFSIASVVAVLKSLSPAGKRLGPMLAISAQGGLFTAGPLLLGANVFGTGLGAVLSGAWAFVQPLLTYYLLFGDSIVRAGDYYYQKMRESFAFEQESLWLVLWALLVIKSVLELVSVALAFRLPEAKVLAYRERMLGVAAAHRMKATGRARAGGNSASASARGALRDMLHPLFLVSFALTTFFFYFSETDHSQMIWILLRPLAVGFLLFFALRILPWPKISARLERSPLKAFSKSLRVAAEQLKEKPPASS